MKMLEYIFGKMWCYQSTTCWKSEPLYTCYKMYWTILLYFSYPIMMTIYTWGIKYSQCMILPTWLAGGLTLLIPIPFSLITYYKLVKNGRYKEVISHPDSAPKWSKFVGWCFYWGGVINVIIWIVLPAWSFRFFEPFIHIIFQKI